VKIRFISQPLSTSEILFLYEILGFGFGRKKKSEGEIKTVREKNTGAKSD